jgi:hypothetical protein
MMSNVMKQDEGISSCSEFKNVSYTKSRYNAGRKVGSEKLIIQLSEYAGNYSHPASNENI